MTYLQFINKIRCELKDFAYLHKETFDGDGSTQNFIANYLLIKDNSYTVKVGGVEKTEDTDYVLDRDTGILTFNVAPVSGSDNVEISYKSVKIRDEDYLEIINDAIDHFRWKFWKEADDTTSIVTTKDQNEYDLSSLTGIIYLIHAWYKTSTTSTTWEEIQGLTNWKYLSRQTKLYVDPAITNGSLPLKFRYLKSFTKATVTSATLDIPDEWLLPYKFYCYARFYERLISEKIHETAAVTTMPSYTPAQVVFSIAESYYKKAEETANKIAPKLPNMMIKQSYDGISM